MSDFYEMQINILNPQAQGSVTGTIRSGRSVATIPRYSNITAKFHHYRKISFDRLLLKGPGIETKETGFFLFTDSPFPTDTQNEDIIEEIKPDGSGGKRWTVVAVRRYTSSLQVDVELTK